jgi:hypothetical protein
MELAPDFVFQPLPPIAEDSAGAATAAAASNPLGALAGLAGKWSGTGFNVIWRPFHEPATQDRFLELNVTSDQLEFDTISGAIPNRGLLQGDIEMFGLTYLQQITDANLKAGLHIEPGLWVNIPQTSDPGVPPTVARLASIPHGTTIVVQGSASTQAKPPDIPDIGITPFLINQPAAEQAFPEQILTNKTSFRTSGDGLKGITQTMVNNPNSVLQTAVAKQHIASTTTLHVSTGDGSVPGGGTANTAFLKGGSQGPNAVAASVTATFWLETVAGQSEPTQLQYSQIVLLNFNTISWPHVTVGTLTKAK